LLGFSTQMNVATLANNFNVLPLKRRIIMMNLRRTRRAGMLKYVLFAPAAAALLWLSNVDALARTIESKVTKPLTVVNGQPATDAQVQNLQEEQIDHISVLQSESAQQVFGPEARDGAVIIQTNSQHTTAMQTTNPQATPEVDDHIYDVVEQLPEYPGGQAALFDFLVKNMRYPDAAKEMGVQGRVLVRFVVETDGTISDVNATQVLDPNTGHPLSEVVVAAYSSEMTPEQVKQAEMEEKRVEGVKALKAESERVVKSLPGKWTPGRDKGKDVRVKFMLPISFRLQ
ncbi:MAG: energy transducer TonB, partial [Bacteroidales bacterium]|nr:energy transducer TonB [Bacteroidales bacterium]